MEDFLYIILAIVWLVVSIIGGKKKKQQQQQQQQKQQEQKKQAQPQYRSEESGQRQEARDIEVVEPPKQKKETSTDFEELLEQFFGEESQPQKESTAQQAPAPAYSEEREYHKESKPSRRSFEEDISEEEVSQFEGAISDDYEFTAEGKVETIEDLIKSYDSRYQQIEEEDAKLAVVELNEEELEIKEWEFDGQKAIIYSEIINRRYF